MDTDANVMNFFFRRVGDAERDACVEILIQHHVGGRLSAEELGHRQNAALRATTAAELAGLVADLPRPEGTPEVDSSPRRPPPAAAPESALLPFRIPDRVHAWTRVLGPPAAVGITAFTVTMGIGDGQDTALWASLVTGAVGSVSTWLATRRK